jgi:hypothetical protein
MYLLERPGQYPLTQCHKAGFLHRHEPRQRRHTAPHNKSRLHLTANSLKTTIEQVSTPHKVPVCSDLYFAIYLLWKPCKSCIMNSDQQMEAKSTSRHFSKNSLVCHLQIHFELLHAPSRVSLAPYLPVNTCSRTPRIVGGRRLMSSRSNSARRFRTFRASSK